MSTLTWLDFSDAERKRALQVVELLVRPETRDELGLGAIRDAFAKALFPGMSTVQRRARYFLFVPWTFREAEQRWAGRSDALERTRRRELQLIVPLLETGETDGVIGSSARANLKQVPSMIYWAPRGPRWPSRGSSIPRELPETQAPLPPHARRFSERMHGAALLYNLELARRRGDEPAEADYRGELEEWAASES